MMISSTQKRILPAADTELPAKKPRPDPDLLRRLAIFAGKWALQFKPVESDYDFSIEKWLSETKYPEWRKEELRKAWDEGHVYGASNTVKSHLKDEQRNKWAHARTINSRVDYYKVLFGPIVHACEKRMFESSKFAKYVPQRERWRFIFRRLWCPGAAYTTTDFDQFESHFINVVKEVLVIPMYSGLLRECQEVRETFLGNYRRFILAPQGQHLVSKYFELLFAELECSGEMDTSFNNGGSNACLFDFFNFEKDFVETETNTESPNQIVAEGDDGVSRNDPDKVVDGADYRKAGFMMKQIIVHNIEDTDFCGIYGESDDFMSTTDPRECLGTFGWCLSRYVNCKRPRLLELLRAKSMSYFDQYERSPIIQSLALYGMRVTKHIDMERYFKKDRYTNRWDMEQYLAAYERLRSKSLTVLPVHEGLRRVVESRFGICVRDQIEIERYLDSLDRLTFFNNQTLFDIMPNMYIDYGLRYTYWEGECSEPFVDAVYDNMPDISCVTNSWLLRG